MRDNVPMSLRKQQFVRELYLMYYNGNDKDAKYELNFGKDSSTLRRVVNDTHLCIEKGVIVRSIKAEAPWGITCKGISERYVEMAFRFVLQYTLVTCKHGSSFASVVDNYPLAFKPVTRSIVRLFEDASISTIIAVQEGGMNSANMVWKKRVYDVLSRDKFLTIQVLTLPVQWANVDTITLDTEYGQFVIVDKVTIKKLPDVPKTSMLRFAELHKLGAAIHNSDYVFGREFCDE
jgi:hypothetical protein